MPIYEYRCDNCAREFEVLQGSGEKDLQICEYCGGKLKRLVSRPTLLRNAGIYLFDRRTRRDIIHDG